MSTSTSAGVMRDDERHSMDDETSTSSSSISSCCSETSSVSDAVVTSASASSIATAVAVAVAVKSNNSGNNKSKRVPVPALGLGQGHEGDSGKEQGHSSAAAAATPETPSMDSAVPSSSSFDALLSKGIKQQQAQLQEQQQRYQQQAQTVAAHTDTDNGTSLSPTIAPAARPAVSSSSLNGHTALTGSSTDSLQGGSFAESTAAVAEQQPQINKTPSDASLSQPATSDIDRATTPTLHHSSSTASIASLSLLSRSRSRSQTAGTGTGTGRQRLAGLASRIGSSASNTVHKLKDATTSQSSMQASHSSSSTTSASMASSNSSQGMAAGQGSQSHHSQLGLGRPGAHAPSHSTSAYTHSTAHHRTNDDVPATTATLPPLPNLYAYATPGHVQRSKNGSTDTHASASSASHAFANGREVPSGHSHKASSSSASAGGGGGGFFKTSLVAGAAARLRNARNKGGAAPTSSSSSSSPYATSSSASASTTPLASPALSEVESSTHTSRMPFSGSSSTLASYAGINDPVHTSNGNANASAQTLPKSSSFRSFVSLGGALRSVTSTSLSFSSLSSSSSSASGISHSTSSTPPSASTSNSSFAAHFKRNASSSSSTSPRNAKQHANTSSNSNLSTSPTERLASYMPSPQPQRQTSNGRTGGSGASLSPSGVFSRLSSSPLSGPSSNSSSDHRTTSSSSALGGQASMYGGGAGLSRATSTKMRTVLGVKIPVGRAGQVFGAPLHVAADRTRLLPLPKEEGGQVGGGGMLKRAPSLPERCALDAKALERRQEACMYLPAIAIRCLDYLNEHGKSEEGLYRIPGSTLQINNIRAIFDAGNDVDLLSKLSTRDLEPSAVASCFKLWLRELPESLLHNMEREIDILLLEHTGNAASSKVTMAQAQSSSTNSPSAGPSLAGSPNPLTCATAELQNQQQQAQGLSRPQIIQANNAPVNGGAAASPLVVARIKALFARELPKENVILLREICYHLAHLDAHSRITKMTFSNLRLILSPTLRLSPVMLALLVNERETIFPQPGELSSSKRSDDHTGVIRFSTRPLDLSLPGPMSTTPSAHASQPQLSLAVPGADGLPPMPPSKSPTGTLRPSVGTGGSAPPALRAPFSSVDSGWTSLASTSSSSGASANSKRKSSGSMPGYRASWHVVDLPHSSGSGNKDSLDSESGDELHASTPIARKFLHQRTASASNLLEKASSTAPGAASPASSIGSRRSFSSTAATGSAGNVLARTPTLTGRSPSPFFSSGAPPAALGFMTSHQRKRSSASSLASIVSNSLGPDGRPLWRSRKASFNNDQDTHKVQSQQPAQSSSPQQRVTGPAQDEEEELSNSSDTNTSICSSASSAMTPKDAHDIDASIASNPGNNSATDVAINIVGDAESEADGSDFDSRRKTITAETFTSSFARLGRGKDANSDEVKRKRGSMMILNMPEFSN